MNLQNILFPVLLISLLTSCTSQNKFEKKITEMEATLNDQTNSETIQELLNLYLEGAQQSSSPEKEMYLWKAAETARGLRQFQLAEEKYQEIYNQSPQSEYASKALFLHAFMSDEDEKDFDKAKALYETFLEKYPNSEFVDDAQFLLENLGKSDEEILKILTEKNAENL